MIRELGLFSIKIFLIINILILCCLPVRTTLIRRGKQNELINPSPQPQTTTETETASLSTTEISNSDSVSNENTSSIVSSSTVQNPNNSVEISSTTIKNEEITKPTIQTFSPQQQQQPQQQNQQQQLYPWNIMWNSAQSILPILPPSWWPYSPNQQNPSMNTISSSSSSSAISSSISSSSTNNLQATPVASLTLTFGKTSVNNKGIGSNAIGAGASGGVGIFGCPPPIVISGVCPEATCNCQCDNNKKIMPSSVQPKPLDTVAKSSSSSPLFSQVQKQQTQGFLPFQSWQDFFLKPVQLISSRAGGRNVKFTSTEGDKKL